MRHIDYSCGGSIINLSSIYGIISAPDLPAYHASKGAVRLMAKTDDLLYATDNIRVNSIYPGYIWTPLVEALAEESTEGVEAFRKNLDALHPIGNVGEPMDIAYGALYLASAESKFVTGSELVIDGDTRHNSTYPFAKRAGIKKKEKKMLRSVKELYNYVIEAEDGEIGHVEDFIVDDDVWTIRYIDR